MAQSSTTATVGATPRGARDALLACVTALGRGATLVSEPSALWAVLDAAQRGHCVRAVARFLHGGFRGAVRRTMRLPSARRKYLMIANCAVTRDGAALLVTNKDDAALSVVDARDGALLRVIGGLAARPQAVAVASDGTVFVATLTCVQSLSLTFQLEPGSSYQTAAPVFGLTYEAPTYWSVLLNAPTRRQLQSVCVSDELVVAGNGVLAVYTTVHVFKRSDASLVRSFDLAEAFLRHRPDAPDADFVYEPAALSLSFLHDGVRMAAAVTTRGHICTINARSGVVLASWQAHCQSLACTALDEIIAACEQTVCVFSADGALLRTVPMVPAVEAVATSAVAVFNRVVGVAVHDKTVYALVNENALAEDQCVCVVME